MEVPIKYILMQSHILIVRGGVGGEGREQQLHSYALVRLRDYKLV